MKRFLILLLIAGSAHAEFKDGNQLYAQMTNGDNNDWFNAIGYVTGVSDAQRGTISCPQANVTAGQLFDMVKNYLGNTPAIRHLPADGIIGYVMGKSWPCAKKGSSL